MYIAVLLFFMQRAQLFFLHIELTITLISHAESSTSYHLFFLHIELTITLISHAESSTSYHLFFLHIELTITLISHAESSTSYHLFFLRIELTITLISHAESSTIVGSTGFYVLVSLGGLFLTVVLITLILVVAGLCRQRRLKYYSGGSAQRESDTQPIVMEGFPQNEYPTDDVETKE